MRTVQSKCLRKGLAIIHPPNQVPKEFCQEFPYHLLRAKELLEAEKCLVKDFQIMVNAKGELFHLDFDRCFRSTGKKWHKGKSFTSSCLKALDKMDRRIQKVLDALPNLL